MNLSTIRIRALVVKEMRDYRRNRFIAGTMVVLPLVFVVFPMVDIFKLSATAKPAALDNLVGISLFYLLLIPALVPAVIASYAVVGEREQGTFEPLLTTPVRREEFLLGKFLAAFVPTLVIAYLMYGIFLACVAAFAHPNVADDVFRTSRMLPQFLFTPLLAGWSIWVGIAISARSSDVRVAQQLGSLASLPPLAVTTLMGVGVLQPTLALGLGFGLALLAVDLLAWRGVALLLDRERVVTGTKATRGVPATTPVHPENDGEKPMTATLKIDRTMSFAVLDRKQSWQIHLDDAAVGSIARDGTFETPISSGRHTLHLTSTGRHRSPRREFDAADDSIVEFACHAQPFWPLMLMALVVPGRWIVLKRR